MDFHNVVAVSNRHLCFNDFFEQLKKIADLGVGEIIVREKDLGEEAYLRLFEGCLNACEGSGARLIPHTYLRCANEYRTGAVHLPLGILKRLSGEGCNENECAQPETLSEALKIRTGTQCPPWGECAPSGVYLGKFEISTSVHSVEQAALAVRLGASVLVAGHVFATDCKKGLMPKGLDFLREVCNSVEIPVYAIGGIDGENYVSALEAGAKKVCMMSGLMKI